MFGNPLKKKTRKTFAAGFGDADSSPLRPPVVKIKLLNVCLSLNLKVHIIYPKRHAR